MNHRQRVLSYLDSFASGEPDEIVAHVTDDFDNRQVAEIGAGCQGKEVYRQRLVGFLADFAQLRYVADDVIVDGDQVAVTYNMSCLYMEKPVTIAGVMVITLREGLIAIRADYWDGLTFLNQTE